MYHKVYDPDGKMFEVTHNKLSELVLNHGWTQQPPVVEEPKPTVKFDGPKFTGEPVLDEEPKVEEKPKRSRKTRKSYKVDTSDNGGN